MSNTSAANGLKGLEGMILLKQGKIGVLTNNRQFIPYTSFNTDFSDEIEQFCKEYEQDPDRYKLGSFNFDSYSHLEEIDWDNANLILAGNVFKKIKILEDSLPAEIKQMRKLPVEKCMSSYMGMRRLSIFGCKLKYYPVLMIQDKDPIVINFYTATAKPGFEDEVRQLILTSPVFTKCKSEDFKNSVLNHSFDDLDIDELSKHI
ncbi:MAG: hypothetical protein KJN89_04125 [Gammaproteobacteria bacterium]|nr:hypothetical protein [Gammaproteobacteria bacterium]MBT8133680.1 hypothetical protein [Gammaproteobacteria bacterium]NNJ49538.1 hypothetical protein [Gammaproteobacteria bacterium]